MKSLICANCESSQFLQITASKMYFRDERQIQQHQQEMKCTMCSATGKYQYENRDGEITENTTGDIEQTHTLNP